MVAVAGLLETGDHAFLTPAICSAAWLTSLELHRLGGGIEKAGGWIYSGYRCHSTGAPTTRKEGELWNLSLSLPCSLRLPLLGIMVLLSELWPAPPHHPYCHPLPILPLDPLQGRGLGKRKPTQVFPSLKAPSSWPLPGEHLIRSVNRLWPFRVYTPPLPLPGPTHQVTRHTGLLSILKLFPPQPCYSDSIPFKSLGVEETKPPATMSP